MATKVNRFSVMVAGTKGCGKSSFFDNLVGKKIIQEEAPDEINVYMLNLDCEGIMQKITFIDTQGFNSTNDLLVQNNIINFIKEQFDLFMAEENKIRRNSKYEDTRVHCLLYFFPATGCGLKQTDLHFLQNVKNLVNIIPVISKADGLSNTEVKKYKNLIIHQFNQYEIPIFNLENNDLLTEQILEMKLNSIVPFTIINGYEKVKFINNYEIEIDNPNFNDLSILREVILSSHLDALIDQTATILYENYRTTALESVLGEKQDE